MSLIDEPIPVGAPVEPRNGHTPMHANEPTWCKDCGKFSCYWGAEHLCATCGKPATCFGVYEHHLGYACDECCGHGCEDGFCEPLTNLCPSASAGTYDTDTAAGRRQILDDLGVSR